MDPAHAQKRAFEAALAAVLAERVLGTGARAELRGAGRDRLALLLIREADAAMTLHMPGAEEVAFSEPYAAGGVVLATTASSPVREIRDLDGGSVAVTRGEVDAAGVAQRFLQEQSLRAEVQMFPSLAAAVDALEAGQVAAVLADRTGVAVLERQRSGRLRVVADVLRQPYVVATRSDTPELLARIDETLRQLLASGEIRELARRADFPYESP